MTAFLTSLGGKLAERWLAGLMLPGVVFVCVVVAGTGLGHGHALDHGALRDTVDRFAASQAGRSGGTLLLLAVATIVAAVAVSAFVRALGELVARLWTGPWGRAGAPLTRRRVRAWRAAARRYEDGLRAKARVLLGTRAPAALPDTAALAAARDRIALTEPRLPTWMGDRVLAVEERVRTAYDLDLATVWPRIWLTLGEEVRAPLSLAQADFTGAARCAAWGTLYLGLGIWWWPGALVGAATWAVAWWRGRTAVECLAQLVESVVDLRAGQLALALGRQVAGPFTPADGASVTRILRKGY
ncbi:hypothetical protein ACFW42_09965 [Streptomyces albidoflavus]